MSIEKVSCKARTLEEPDLYDFETFSCLLICLQLLSEDKFYPVE